MMFGWSYKNDAMKWRGYQKELDDAELLKVAKMVCDIYLVCGDVMEYELIDKSERRQFFEHEYIHGCERGIEVKFEKLCKIANTEGLYIDGSFYPSAQIKRIDRGKAEVTE